MSHNTRTRIVFVVRVGTWGIKVNQVARNPRGNAHPLIPRNLTGNHIPRLTNRLTRQTIPSKPLSEPLKPLTGRVHHVSRWGQINGPSLRTRSRNFIRVQRRNPRSTIGRACALIVIHRDHHVIGFHQPHRSLSLELVTRQRLIRAHNQITETHTRIRQLVARALTILLEPPRHHKHRRVRERIKIRQQVLVRLTVNKQRAVNISHHNLWPRLVTLAQKLHLFRQRNCHRLVNRRLLRGVATKHLIGVNSHDSPTRTFSVVFSNVVRHYSLVM